MNLTCVVFCAMMLVFFTANPIVFSNWSIYNSVLITLPVVLFMVVPLVFVVVVGEIDLSFPSVMAFAAWIFALLVQTGMPVFVAILIGIGSGVAVGAMIGVIVVYGGLSSLVATLGLNFLIRGFILIMTEGKSISLLELRGTPIHSIMSGSLFGLPAQIIWALLFVAFSIVIFNRHQFGVRAKCAGDNPDSASQMGINVNRTRVMTFAFVGLGAGLAGIFSTMINFTWWPTAGDGYLLPVWLRCSLAARRPGVVLAPSPEVRSEH